MSDRLTKVSIDSVLYDLGSKGINSYETLADMVAEEISNLYDGCIAYCVEDELYYQWKSTNELIATYARWRVLEFGSKSQIVEMPEPSEDLNGSVVQYIGETNATYKKGWFYTCVFANDGFVQTVCTADTRGDFYLKESDGSYTLIQLDGTNFDADATYYQKVNAVSRWDEISTQSTDNKVDKIDGKGLSTNDFTDEEKENYDEAYLKSHEHDNKEVLDGITAENIEGYNEAAEKAHEHSNLDVLDKLTKSDDGKVLYNGAKITDNVWHGTRAEFNALADDEKSDDVTYVVTDEEDTLSNYVIDNSATATDKTWSSEKIDGEFIHNLTTLEKDWFPQTISTEKTAIKNGFLSVTFRVTSTIRIDICDDDIVVWRGDVAGQTADNVYASAFVPIIKGHKYKTVLSDANKLDTISVNNSVFYS